MYKLELHDLPVRNSVSSYIIKEKLHEGIKNLRIELGDCRQENGSFTLLTLPEGTVSFKFKGYIMTYNTKKVGIPVSGKIIERDSVIHENVYIEGDDIKSMEELVKISLEEKQMEKKFSVFSWNARGEHWKKDTSIPNRCINSVILNKNNFDKLMEDLRDFTENTTKEWYLKHGIPFKRGYLFYGKPGTGKTSTIAAIATYLNRRVYRLNLVAPGLCDSSLLEAVNCVKKDAILVMEDIDALFGVHREKNESFSTTYSGLLNAIDGLGDAKGHIFIMTTNHPEKIDPALKRKGRIDLELEFGICDKQQAKNMFLKFYPGSYNEAEMFSKQVEYKSYTTAMLQHHFIANRKNTASESINIREDIFDDNFEIKTNMYI